MSQQTKNIIYAVVGALAIIAIAFLVTRKPQVGNEATSPDVVSVVDGKQIINVTAKGGYYPRVISAKANIPTTLRMTTKNTFDCSISFVMPKLNIRKMLGTTATNDFEIPAQQPGQELVGTCAMGMYSFKISFQ